MFRRHLIYAAVGIAVVVRLGVAAVTGASSTVEFATCEYPAAAIIPSDWASKRLSSGSNYYDALFSPEAQNRILAGPLMPIPSFSANTDDQIGLIKQGKLFVDKRVPVIDLNNVDWVTNDHNYVSTQLHGLAGVGTVFSSDEEAPGDVEAALGAHISNWALCSAHNRDINPRAWHEGTVIKRQSNLLHTLNYIRSHGPIEHLDLPTLLYLIDANATFLLDTPHVYAQGNHGIRQDMLLAATALSLPSHPRANEMLRLAEKRLDEAAENLFTKSGIWLEHAPGYVYYALRLMRDVKRLHEAAPEFDPRLFLHHYDSSLNYLLSSLLPDRSVPRIGMSSTDEVGSGIASAKVVEAHLSKHERSLAAFPEYGHAMVRGDHPDGLYLLFVAAQNLPAGKRHADDLTLILYNLDRLWITEGGHQSYEDSAMTRFLRSPLAHNTYVLDGEFIASDTNRNLTTRLTGAEAGPEGYFVSGYTERYAEPATAKREILVDRDFSTVRIEDTLAAKDAKKWEGRFQIPGDLDVSVDGNTAIAADLRTGREMVMTFRSEAPLTFSMCKGEEKPMCGWGQNPDGFGPVTTLMWSTTRNDEIEIEISFR